jgi:hypothetical protein
MLIRIASAVLVAGLSSAAMAQPTAFTYQGRLKNGSALASGAHDFRFRLYDAATGGTQVGATLCVDNAPVAEGLFATTLDFGQQFATPSPRFLEIEVRTDTGLDCQSAAGFVVLTPRQPVTSAPVAAHATSAFTLDSANGALANAVFVDNAGRVGMGTLAPTHSLHIANPAPTIAIQDSDSTTQQVGYISYRDSGSVERAWVGYGSPGDPDFSIVNARPAGDIVLNPLSGNVGIGTSSPGAALDVHGSIKLGTASEYFAVKSPANDRIVRGYVTFSGNIDANRSAPGFSMVPHSTTGSYGITFSPAFASPPTIVVTSAASTSHAVPTLTSTTSAGVLMYRNTDNVLTDEAFTFIAIGQ